jgi:hypothetical protein
MAPKEIENNFLVSTLGKLLVFLVNYAYLFSHTHGDDSILVLSLQHFKQTPIKTS